MGTEVMVEPGRRQGPNVAFWIEPTSQFCLNPAHWDQTSAPFGPSIRRIKIGHFGEMPGGLSLQRGSDRTTARGRERSIEMQ